MLRTVRRKCVDGAAPRALPYEHTFEYSAWRGALWCWFRVIGAAWGCWPSYETG